GRNDTGGAQRQQRAGEAAGSGPDLVHGGFRKRFGGACNAIGEIEVEQKILAERFFRRETVAANDLAQRRQAVFGAGHDAASEAGLSALASRAASRSAATRLVGSARPVPAISKAVPWSGEVRTKGRPSVTLTAWSKASVLIGISAWS